MQNPTPTPPDRRKLSVSIPDACDLVGVGRSKMYAMINTGEVEACKIGRRTTVTRRSLDALIERGVSAALQTWPR
ncbi:helix-turn-helix domain-containing protein [Sphingomonas sp. Tas61C01]|uniref:helix-turn-helix domain-containing protein n=1 Tax=Sphingomonas sp. Tas61C01 TaxID=3458297 RepID=UPI00403EA368